MRRVLALLFVSLAAAAGAQPAQVTHAAAMHDSWSSSSAVVEHLDVGATVSTSTHRAGYTHVTAPDGKPGWVYSRYLTAAASPASPTPPPAPSPAGTTLGLTPVSDIAALPKPAPVEANDASCPNVGGHSSVRLDSATNLLKNRIQDGTYSAVTFAAMLGLPWQGMRPSGTTGVRTIARERATTRARR
jgi:hypothetical protein